MRRRDLAIAATAAALLRARAARSQPTAMPLIGFLHGSAPIGPYPSYVASFVAGLNEQGFETGRNITIEYRWAEGRYERVPSLAAELVALHPAVAVFYGPPSVVRAAIAGAPKTLPIVFGTGGDPVAAGIVASLARPGGNVTGVANRTNALDVKRLEILRDLLPQVDTIGLIINPKNSDAAAVTEAARQGASSLGRRLVVADASTPEELDKAFDAAVAQGARALLMGSDAYFNALRDRIVGLAAQHRLPAIYNFRGFVEIGGLISYGADFADNYRLIGAAVGKILKGAKPADLPVIEPTKFELVINLKTAHALGLAVPVLLLSRVDAIIE